MLSCCAIERAPPTFLALPTQARRHSLSYAPDQKLQRTGEGLQSVDGGCDDLRVENVTVMFADIVESMQLSPDDELARVRMIRILLAELISGPVSQLGGELIERRGDGVLVFFKETHSALRAAAAFHVRLAETSAPRVAMRVGLHRADVMRGHDGVHGYGLSLAARIAGLAQPGSTVVSAAVRDDSIDTVDGDFVDMGECYLKHVVDTVRLFRVQTPSTGREDLRTANLAPPSWSDFLPRLAVASTQTESSDSSDVQRQVLADLLVCALQASSAMRVVSRLSACGLSTRGYSPPEIASVLSVEYVLLLGEGSEDGSAIGFTVSMFRRGNANAVWIERVAFSRAALLHPQSDELLALAQNVCGAVTAVELRIAGGMPMPNLAAHTLYLASVTALHRFSRTEFERARLMLVELSERAPRHVNPAAWLARWHVFNIVQGWSTDPVVDGAKATDCVNRALDRDPGSALALTIAGSVAAGVRRDLHAANDCYARALERNPNEPLAWVLKGVAHGFLGEHGDALAASETALALTPLDPMRFYYDSLSSSAAATAGEYERAIRLSLQAIRANRMHGSAYRTLAACQVLVGQVDEAKQTVRELLAIDPSSTVALFRARSAIQTPQNERFAEALAAAGLPDTIS